MKVSDELNNFAVLIDEDGDMGSMWESVGRVEAMERDNEELKAQIPAVHTFRWALGQDWSMVGRIVYTTPEFNDHIVVHNHLTFNQATHRVNGKRILHRQLCGKYFRKL